MRTLPLVLLVSFGAVTLSRGPDAASLRRDAELQGPGQASASVAKDRFTGTWKLVTTERRDAQGALLPPATPGPQNRIGYITYDPAGYMAVAIMQPGRPTFASQDSTPQEAQAALTGYTAYFGTFTVNEAERVVTHHTQGALSPSMSGTDQRRSYEFAEIAHPMIDAGAHGDAAARPPKPSAPVNRLTLKPPRGADGVQSSLTWEKVPDLPALTPMHRRFIGFYKLVSNERRNAKGELVSSNSGQTGFIIYTSSGHMMAHLMQPGRKRYAAAQPAPDEALAALSTYTNYFGTYTIHDADRYVVHHRIGIVNPSQVGSDVQRFYEFSGRRLILRPPATTVDGQQVQSVLTWERLSADTVRSQ